MSSEIMNLRSQAQQDVDASVESVSTGPEEGEALVETQKQTTDDSLLDAWSNLASGGETPMSKTIQLN